MIAIVFVIVNVVVIMNVIVRVTVVVIDGGDARDCVPLRIPET